MVRPAKVKEFMGVEPHQVADLLALKGDAIDNIPGAPGIGDKGARDLIEQFGSVEAALDRAGEVQRKMYRESLQNNRERILMSKQLATIETNVPIEFSFADLEVQAARHPRAQAIYKELEFHSLLQGTGAHRRSARARHRSRSTASGWTPIPAGRLPSPSRVRRHRSRARLAARRSARSQRSLMAIAAASAKMPRAPRSPPT